MTNLEKQPTSRVVDNTKKVYSPSTTNMAMSIKSAINGLLKLSHEQDTIKIHIDLNNLEGQMQNAFWSASKNNLFIITPENTLANFVAKDAETFLKSFFGEIINYEQFCAYANEQIRRITDNRQELTKLLTKIRNLPTEMVLIDHKKNQRDKVNVNVDIFADKSYILRDRSKVTVYFRHEAYESPIKFKQIDQSVVADYKEHFPQLDDFISFLVASRFTVDRKKCYLWFKCTSDWGKGLLFNEMKRYGLVTETSLTEVEKMISGSPVGKSYHDFIDSLILWVDEFTNVTSELKVLCSDITISTKYQLSMDVPLYLKIFTSAESVSSLANEYGVEDQFANRFAFIEGSGSIEKREKWKKVGKTTYGDNVISYIINIINRDINDYIKLGKILAANKADTFIDKYHEFYSIDKTFSKLSDNLILIANEILDFILNENNFSPVGKHLKKTKDNGNYLSSASKVVSIVIDELYDKSSSQAYQKRRDEIIQLLSSDGQGIKQRRVEGKNGKFLKLKSPDDFDLSGLPSI
ncbi:hypothetical protein [Moritella dasanensis]|uniref:hypothetical protein n=1 Tax=Moritella dasanensis TaxID=428031 RepID=UPI0002FCAF7D|nr:hypothetical protein [Moritella dasanensis]